MHLSRVPRGRAAEVSRLGSDSKTDSNPRTYSIHVLTGTIQQVEIEYHKDTSESSCFNIIARIPPRFIPPHLYGY